MPIQSLVHLCSVCLTTHDTFEGAIACEQLGFPIDIRFIKGTTLVFEDERQTGSHWAYSTASGIVLASFAVLDSNKRCHRWAHIVETQDMFSYEHVVWNTERGMLSPAEAKYNRGYAQHTIDKLMRHCNSLSYPIQY